MISRCCCLDQKASIYPASTIYIYMFQCELKVLSPKISGHVYLYIPSRRNFAQMFISVLKEETFAGRNFRGFAVFSQIRESLFPRNFSKDVIHESFFPRNFLKKSSFANILKKIRFCSYDLKLLWHS